MSIAGMVEQMMERGIDRDMILLAIRTAENSSGNSVESRLEKIRTADRARKQAKKLSTGIPVEIPVEQETPLTLTSSQQEIAIKESKKVRVRKSAGEPIPADYKPNQKHYEAADRLKLPHSAVDEKCEDMRLWAVANGIIRPGWDATLHQFLRRDADKLRKSNGQGSVLAAADKLIERIREFDQPAPAEQRQLCGGTGEIALRPIPEG